MSELLSSSPELLSHYGLIGILSNGPPPRQPVVIVLCRTEIGLNTHNFFLQTGPSDMFLGSKVLQDVVQSHVYCIIYLAPQPLSKIKKFWEC